nr:MAG TPA: nucleoid-associated protein [Caudoviricetes sp.]
MIYLHPSLGISNAPATPPRITDPSYIDRIYEFVGVQKAQFSLVIEASNGTVLDDIKETRLTAHLFDADGRELTEHLTALSLYWEEHNETWTEVGRGWSYLVNDNSRFLRLLRVRVSQLDIMTALGLTIDAETKKTLAGIMVQQEVKITSSSSIYNRIPSVEALHDSLVNDVHFRELVKGAQGPQGKPGAAGAPGKDGKSVTAQEVVSAINTDSFRGSIRDALKGDATFVAATRGEKGERGVQGVQGKPGAAGAPGKDGKSVTAQEVVSTINTDSFRGSIRDALKGDATFVAATRGEKGERGAQGVQGKPGAAGAPGKDGKSVTAQEVADTINTADWQNQIASATASNIIKTPILSDKLRELVQPDTTELIKRLSSRTMQQDILSQNGGKYLINVPAFALFEPEVEDGAAISLQVSIRQPIGSCTNPNNHDERGYFFIVKSWEPIYTTSAEKLCKKGGEIKVYYDSEQCAESLLSIKLERSNDHWIFVNYYDFAASIQADCTQIVPQSHYSNKSQDEMLSYAPLQHLSGKKRNAVLPTGRVGIVIRVWANKWVGDVRVRTELGESLYNTSDSTGGNIGSDGALIPAGHIGEFICINEEKIWLYTDLSR